MEAYHGFLFLGIPLGFYKEEGIDVEFGTAAGSAATMQLVAAGQVQMGYIGMDVLILAKARNPNLPVTAVYLHDRGNIYEIVVPEQSDIKQVPDLKDKNIGVANLASGAIPSLRATLSEAGLNPDTSVGLIPVGNGAQAAAALRANRVQALSLFRAQHALIETLDFKFRYFTRDAPSAVIVVNSNFLKENRDTVVKMLRGIAKGSTFAEANPEATVRAFWAMFGKPQGLSEDEAMQRQKHVLSSSAKLWKDYRNTSVRHERRRLEQDAEVPRRAEASPADSARRVAIHGRSDRGREQIRRSEHRAESRGREVIRAFSRTSSAALGP